MAAMEEDEDTNNVASNTTSGIMCCMCGVIIQPNPSNMCVNCIRNQVKTTQFIFSVKLLLG